jgi:hypothetical protein
VVFKEGKVVEAQRRIRVLGAKRLLVITAYEIERCAAGAVVKQRRKSSTAK